MTQKWEPNDSFEISLFIILKMIDGVVAMLCKSKVMEIVDHASAQIAFQKYQMERSQCSECQKRQH